jgi:hypothetical protein
MDVLYESIMSYQWPLVAGLLILAVPLAPLFRRQGIVRLAPLVPPLLACVLVLAGLLIETDRQKIDRLLRDAAAAVEAGRWDDLSTMMTDDFQLWVGNQTQTTNRKEAIREARDRADLVRLRSFTPGEQRVTLAGPHGQANVRFAVSCGLGLTAKNDTRWRIRLLRGDDGRWRMSEAALLEVNGQPVVNMPGLP